ncbi:MAG: hypothetical protein AAGD06_04705 [Acidobacteriota bacterium]
MSADKAKGMKSAYELALERLEQRGIDRPDAASLSEEDRREMQDVRQRAEAKLAELQILHRDRMAKADPVKRYEEEEEYGREVRRIEEDRDAKLERIRQRRRQP